MRPENRLDYGVICDQISLEVCKKIKNCQIDGIGSGVFFDSRPCRCRRFSNEQNLIGLYLQKCTHTHVESTHKLLEW